MENFKILSLGLPVKLSAEQSDFLCKELKAKNERIAELEYEVSQSDEILAEHDLANYKIITNQSKRIVELEAKLAGSNYTLNLSLRKYKELNESQAIRDLEQGVKHIANAIAFTGVAVYSPPDDPHAEALAHNDALSGVDRYAKGLTEQAKKLREQAKGGAK